MLSISSEIQDVGTQSLSINESKIPKLTVNFQYSFDYKGEYGFDYYRDYYENKLSDQSKLEDLKNEYTPTKINGSDYYVPWLAIKKNASADIFVVIDVLEELRGSQKKDKIILPQHDALEFEPSEIELSEVAKTNGFDVTVTCKGALKDHAYLDVKLSTSGKKVGQLNVFKNNTNHSIKIRFVKVITYPGKAYTDMKSAITYSSELEYLDSVLEQNNIKDFIENHSLNQALIDVDFDSKEYVIELDGDSLQAEQKIVGYELTEGTDYSKNFLGILFNQYKEEVDNVSSNDDINIFLTTLQKHDNGTIGGQTEMYGQKRYCSIYRKGLSILSVFAHELGHVLWCEHSFVDSEPMSTAVFKAKLQKAIEDCNQAIINHPNKTGYYQSLIEECNCKINKCDILMERNPYRFNNKSESFNFMDYSGNPNFYYKWQWNTMHKEFEN